MTISRSEYSDNVAIKDRSTAEMSDIADLMEIFVDSDRYDYEKFPKTSERKNQFKNTEEGMKTVSDGIQNLLDKKEQETTVVHLMDIMKNLKLTIDQAMDASSIPQGQRSTYAGLIKNS